MNVLPLSPLCALTCMTPLSISSMPSSLKWDKFPTWLVGVGGELNKIMAVHSLIQQTLSIDFVPDTIVVTGYKTRSQADTMLTLLGLTSSGWGQETDNK